MTNVIEMYWTTGDPMQGATRDSKLHLTDNGETTLCGVVVPEDADYMMSYDGRCKRCEKRQRSKELNNVNE